MKLIVKKNRLNIIHTLKKSETYKVFRNPKYHAIYIFRKPQLVRGITNLTEDSKSILFLDYDNCDKSVIIEDYQNIAKKFRLPPAYLFQTKNNNFHIICLKKFIHGIIPQIMQYSRCDYNYKDSPTKNLYRSYVLRLSGKRGSKKPKFKEIIGEMTNLNYEISKAHLDLLHKIYPKIPHIKYTKLDNLKEIRTQIYQTSVEG